MLSTGGRKAETGWKDIFHSSAKEEDGTKPLGVFIKSLRKELKAKMQARINAGMTQVQLSEATGISQADISRLENGTRNPSLGLLKRLAVAMNTTLRIEFVPNIHTKAKA